MGKQFKLTGTNKKVSEVKNLKIDGIVINYSTEIANKFNLHFSTIADKF